MTVCGAMRPCPLNRISSSATIGVRMRQDSHSRKSLTGWSVRWSRSMKPTVSGSKTRNVRLFSDTSLEAVVLPTPNVPFTQMITARTIPRGNRVLHP
jgi:hypothetical protein